MTVNKRTKASRYRASKTHGCGAMKKRRGAGNRGGRGNSSTGKRSDAKRPSIWKIKKYFGRYGFKNPNVNKKSDKVINLSTLQDKLNTWQAQKKSEGKSVNLTKLGFQKLLAQGKLNQPIEITVEMASKKAIEKVQAAGGSVITAK